MDTKWQDALQSTLAPLHKQLEDLEAQIDERRAEMEELMGAARSIRRVIQAASPAPRSVRKGRRLGQSQGIVDGLATFLRGSNLEDFTISQLHGMHKEHGVKRSKASFSMYVRSLQEQGVVRLDKVEANAQVFKVNRPEAKQGGAHGEAK